MAHLYRFLRRVNISFGPRILFACFGLKEEMKSTNKSHVYADDDDNYNDGQNRMHRDFSLKIIKIMMFDVRCSMFDVRCSMFDVRCQTSDITHQTPDIQHHTSEPVPFIVFCEFFLFEFRIYFDVRIFQMLI